jgi:hypothetical protein
MEHRWNLSSTFFVYNEPGTECLDDEVFANLFFNLGQFLEKKVVKQ